VARLAKLLSGDNQADLKNKSSSGQSLSVAPAASCAHATRVSGFAGAVVPQRAQRRRSE